MCHSYILPWDTNFYSLMFSFCPSMYLLTVSYPVLPSVCVSDVVVLWEVQWCTLAPLYNPLQTYKFYLLSLLGKVSMSFPKQQQRQQQNFTSQGLFNGHLLITRHRGNRRIPLWLVASLQMKHKCLQYKCQYRPYGSLSRKRSNRSFYPERLWYKERMSYRRHQLGE